MDAGTENKQETGNKQEVESAKEGISEATTATTGQTVAYFIIGIFVAVAVVTLVVIFMERTRQQEKASLEQQIADEVTKPLNDLKNEKKQIDTVIAQLGVLSGAISDRFPYTKLMSDLTQKEYKKSMWTNFTFNTEGVEITGATDNYDDVDRVVSSLRATKSVQEADLSSVSVNSETKKVTFTVKLKIDKSLYQKSSKQTGTGGTTQGSPTPVPAAAF